VINNNAVIQRTFHFRTNYSMMPKRPLRKERAKTILSSTSFMNTKVCPICNRIPKLKVLLNRDWQERHTDLQLGPTFRFRTWKLHTKARLRTRSTGSTNIWPSRGFYTMRLSCGLFRSFIFFMFFRQFRHFTRCKIRVIVIYDRTAANDPTNVIMRKVGFPRWYPPLQCSWLLRSTPI
jgi:hypothetical protein